MTPIVPVWAAIILIFTTPPVTHTIRAATLDMCIAARENVLHDLPQWPVVWVTGCELVGRMR